MPKSIEAQGVTVDEAIQTALNLLGLGRDSVEIEIIHHPRSGFLGIGARRAKVRATMREQVLRDGEEFDMAPDAGSRGRRRRRPTRRRTPRGGGEQRPREPRPGVVEGAGRRAGTEARVSEPVPQGQRPRAAEGEAAGGAERRSGEQRGRGRGRRGGRGRGGSAERRAQQGDAGQVVTTTEAVQGEGPVAETSGGGRSNAPRSRPRDQAPQKRLEPEALRSKAHQLTAELLGHMGVEASVDVRIEEGGAIAVTIDAGDSGAMLIGRRGTTLDALEHVINRMTTGADPAARVRVELDVCGYRERRRTALSEVASRLKQHALSTMKRVQITPLSPHDRVVFQEALAGDDSVTTRILGSGFYRRVLVIPRGQESDAGVAEEFNEDGQIVGYPSADAGDEDALEVPTSDGPPLVTPDAASIEVDDPNDEGSEGSPKQRPEES
jgi:spoIIIJ-associated protein